MVGSKLIRTITQPRWWAKVLLTLAFVLVGTTTVAQLPKNFLEGLLPALQQSQSNTRQQGRPTNPTPVQREVIPLARPTDGGEITVEEAGEGLISLKVRDASLRQVVAMIAETQRVNIVFSSPEDVLVTASLMRVPWQKALDSLLAASGHTSTSDQGIVFVTSIAGADLIAPRVGGRRVETFELDFAKAVDIDQTVQGLLSLAGRSWVLESSDADNRQSREVVAVLDYPGNLRQIADYICQADQPPRQVLIKANILQVDLKDDCRSGVNLQQLVSFRGNELKLSSVGLANAAASPASFLTLTGGSLDGLIELLKTTTDAKSLASTELLTVSGQLARIQSGQKLGFRVTTTTQTSTLESVEFIEVGVLLTVTPQVTRDGRILMRIQPKVSDGQVDPNTGLPTEDTVEVETDILLNNGQGLVIGGLIQEVDSNVQNKIPWLGDIPYAGILFQKRQLIKARAEIIVTLIPHVMPYSPIDIAHNDRRMLRTQDPLLSPPLNRYPRPYEPQLPDTFTNPTPVFPNWHYRRAVNAGAVADVATVPTTSELIPLPTVLDPAPAVGEGPLCYPPVGAQQPDRVPQQAARDYPTYR